jgi:hypothetical protein
VCELRLSLVGIMLKLPSTLLDVMIELLLLPIVLSPIVEPSGHKRHEGASERPDNATPNEFRNGYQLITLHFSSYGLQYLLLEAESRGT